MLCLPLPLDVTWQRPFERTHLACAVLCCAVYDQYQADAVDFYAWAKSDPKVAAIAPWNWGGCPTCNGSRFTAPHTCCMDEIGTKDQPLTRAAWIKIGKEIKQAAAEAAAAVASNLWV
jgi:hypothetical protein